MHDDIRIESTIIMIPISDKIKMSIYFFTLSVITVELFC